jgi:hypothetical protein
VVNAIAGHCASRAAGNTLAPAAMNSSTLPKLTVAEQAGFSVFLGLLWAWMVIHDTGLVNRWDTTAQMLDIVILVASIGLWWAWIRYGLPFFGER